jgi:hypothetical protein
MAEFSRLHSKLQDVPIAKMRVSPSAQRDLRPARVAELAAEFNPEDLGYPVISHRDGNFYIIDGQHRVEATKVFLGDGWDKQSLTCRVYVGMTERQEAEMFDRLNNMLAVSAFDKFKVRVTAGKPDESAVQKLVDKVGLKISKTKGEGSLGSVGVLVKIYRRSDGQTLARALRIVHMAFGDPGLTTSVIDGVALLCERYNGAIEDEAVIERLQSMRGGVGALMTRATTLRKQTAKSVSTCVAAAVVDVLNGQRGGRKIPSWWAE